MAVQTFTVRHETIERAIEEDLPAGYELVELSYDDDQHCCAKIRPVEQTEGEATIMEPTQIGIALDRYFDSRGDIVFRGAKLRPAADSPGHVEARMQRPFFFF